MAHLPGSIGELVGDLRHNKGWTQKVLAERAGVTESTLSRIESGTTKQVDAIVLGKLAKALDTSTDYLLGLTCVRTPKYIDITKLGLSEEAARQLVAAHVDEDSFCRYLIGRDMAEIARALREDHKDDFFSIPIDNPLEVAAEIMGQDESEPPESSEAALAFICKRLHLNYTKLTDEEKKWLARIAEKSDLLKNPNPQRGRKRK